MAKRLLLNFDYDGVLVDSFDHLFRLVCATHEETGLGRPPALTDFTLAADMTFAGLAFLSDLTEDRRRAFARHFYARQQHVSGNPGLFDGVGRILGELSMHHDLTVVSANSEPVIRDVLVQHAVDGHFSAVHGAERRKAKSEILADLVNGFDVPPSDAFMIGDTVSDIRHGRQAGVRTIAVTWGFQSADFLRSARPDFAVSSPEALSDLLLELAHGKRS